MLILVMGTSGSYRWWSRGRGGAAVLGLLAVGGGDGDTGGVLSREGGGLPCPEEGRGGC